MNDTNGTPGPTTRQDLDELKARVDLAKVVRAAGIDLKQTGRNLMGCCPFHSGDRRPSLSVNPQSQLWNCFGCEAGGDVLRFLELTEKLEFTQALARLHQLAAKFPEPPAGKRNGKARPPAPEEAELPAGLTRATLLGRVSEHYQSRFRETPEAQQYLVSRGLGSRELWDAFRVGYVDGTLLATLPKSGPVRGALTQLGVLHAKGHEHFRGCLVVPLEHPEEGLAGFYGRAIAAESKVSHLYLPGPKRGVLQPSVLRSARRLWLTESVLDAFSLWVAGVRDVSCLFGVSGLPRDLEAFLGRSEVQEVVLCLDGDRAGQEATRKFSESLTGLGLNCQAVQLPTGKDPNQILMESGGARLRQLVESSVAVFTRPDASEEKTCDGFRLRLEDVTYTVTPQPPFSGRLRALVVAERQDRVHSDSQNLHSNRGRNLLAIGLGKRLELPALDAERHVSRLLQSAMDWVASFEERETSDSPLTTEEAPELSAQDREEALTYLRRPDLVEAILADCAAVGYVGEDKSKLLGYLIGLSRKLPQPLAGIIRSQSGAGKSALTELVEQLTPPEDVRFYSRISPQVLYFLPRDYLQGKLLIVEERSGGETADYPIRTLQSRQKLSLLVTLKDPATGKLTARQYEVDGPIAYLETTTNAQLNPENASRCFELHLDESEEQTRCIQEWQRQKRLPQSRDPQRLAGVICTRHHNLQRMLEPVCVFIPYARMLSFPSRWMRTRRDNERFLSLIEVVAFLHQHQRERGVTEDGSAYVLATPADYRLAYELARGVLAVSLHELSRDAQELWEAVISYTDQSGEGKPEDVLFSRRELREFANWQDYRLRVALAELVEMEYLVVAAGQAGKTFLYRKMWASSGSLNPLGGLTTPEELEKLWP